MTTHPKAKILVIDAMNTARRMLTRYLTSQGYQTLEATDTATGREMAVVNLPDLIVTDVRLGGADGVPMIRALRAIPALDGTPIVVTSTVEDPKVVVAALEAGANDYLTKPLVVQVLRARIAAQLRTKQLHDEIQRRRRDSEMLFETLHEATESGTLDEILFRITQRLGRMMTASRCSIIAVNERRGVGTICASMEDPRARGIQLDLVRYPEMVEAVRTRQPVLVDESSRGDLRSELSEVFRVKQVASILTVPVAFRDQILGVLTMHVREGEPSLTDEHVKFVSMVAFAIGGMVHTARRLESLSTVSPARAGGSAIGVAA